LCSSAASFAFLIFEKKKRHCVELVVVAFEKVDCQRIKREDVLACCNPASDPDRKLYLSR